MKKHLWWRALCCCLVCALLLVAVSCKRGSDAPLSPGLSMVAGEAVYDEDVAMRTDHFTVTPGMMAYFFYTYGNTVMAQMQAYKPYDSSKSLHDQMYTDTLSFYDVIMNETLDKVTQLLVCCEAALAEDKGLTDAERAAVNESVTGYRVTAAANYSKSLSEYLADCYGPMMLEEDLTRVLELETLANRFSLQLRARLEGQITAEQAITYAEVHGLFDDTPSRNIAYLFLPFENGAAPEEKIQAANAAMQESATAEKLLSLTELGSTGSEKNLTPENSGIEQIGAWLFAPERKVGDFGRVDLEGATYLLLYTDNGASFGEVAARMRLFDTAYENWYNAWVDSLQFGYNYDCLDSYDIDKK